jgi:uncharacterized protein DUF6545
MALIGASCGAGVMYVASQTAIEALTRRPFNRSITGLGWPVDAAIVGSSIALILCGARWGWVAGFDVALRERADAWAMRRRILTIQPAWADLVNEIPDITAFPVAVTPAPVGVAQLLVRSPRSIARIHARLSYQQTRLVTEIYDARRRLLLYVNAEQRELIAKKVEERGLRSGEAQTATTAIILRLGMIACRDLTTTARRDNGAPVLGGSSASDAAAQFARSVRRSKRPRVQRVIAEILGEEVPVSGADPDAPGDTGSRL